MPTLLAYGPINQVELAKDIMNEQKNEAVRFKAMSMVMDMVKNTSDQFLPTKPRTLIPSSRYRYLISLVNEVDKSPMLLT